MPLAGKQHNHQAVLDAPKSSGYSLIQPPRSHKRYEPMVPASSRKHGICIYIYIYPSLALSKNVIKKMIHQPWDLLRFCIFRSTPLAINHGNGKSPFIHGEAMRIIYGQITCGCARPPEKLGTGQGADGKTPQFPRRYCILLFERWWLGLVCDSWMIPDSWSGCCWKPSSWLG